MLYHCILLIVILYLDSNGKSNFTLFNKGLRESGILENLRVFCGRDFKPAAQVKRNVTVGIHAKHSGGTKERAVRRVGRLDTPLKLFPNQEITNDNSWHDSRGWLHTARLPCIVSDNL